MALHNSRNEVYKVRPTGYAIFVLLVACVLSTPAQEMKESFLGAAASGFVAHRIDRYRCESCNFSDFNNDGRLDIISGERLYLAPDFKPVVIRKFATVGLEFLKSGGVRQYELDAIGEDGDGYLDVFMDEPFDVDQDGWLDIISSGWFDKKISWYRNPGGRAGQWAEHIISTEMGNHETGEIYDIDGDGSIAEVMPFTWSTLWFEFRKGPQALFEPAIYPVSAARHPFLGGGVGDVDGDGRPDIIRSKAWFQAPSNPRNATGWREHPLEIGGLDGRADQVSLVKVYDVDQDGFNDLVTSSAHKYGIFWYKQIKKGPEIVWKQHVIDSSWTQAQAVGLADVDGDGDQDLITGKRFRAHNGADPQEDAPLGVYWYELQRGEKELWKKHIISYDQKIGVGMKIPIADFDGDGDLDFLVNGKWGGPVWFENRLTQKGNKAEGWQSVSPGLYRAIMDYDGVPYHDGGTGPGGIYVCPPSGDLYVSMHRQEYGVYRSADQGATFTRVDQNKKSGRHWAQFGFDGGEKAGQLAVFAIGPQSCLTHDGWKTADPIPLPKGVQKHDGWTYGVVDWSDPAMKTFFAKEHHANDLWLTRDGGVSWSMIWHEEGFPTIRMVRPMGIASGGILLLSKYDGIIRSTDDGKTWNRVSDFTPVACLPVHHGGHIYWAAKEGVIKSGSNGKSWKLVGKTPTMVYYGPCFGDSEKSYVVVLKDGFYRTNDGGRRFTKIAGFPPQITFDPIIFDEPKGYKESFGWDWRKNILYANQRSGQVYKLELK
jgi:photosystem II stability/assembly factor-like uncharacterized protein